MARYYTMKKSDRKNLDEIFSKDTLDLVKGNEWIVVNEKTRELIEFVFFKKYMRTVFFLDEKNEITSSKIAMVQNTMVRVFNGSIINFGCGLNRAEYINRRLEHFLDFRGRFIRIDLEKAYDLLLGNGYYIIPENFKIENFELNEYVSGSYLGHTSSPRIFKEIMNRYKEDICSFRFSIGLREKTHSIELVREGLIISYTTFGKIEDILNLFVKNEKVIFYE